MALPGSTAAERGYPDGSPRSIALIAKDPICGMTVDEKTARSAVRDGITSYFCCDGCKIKFEQEPEKYVTA